MNKHVCMALFLCSASLVGIAQEKDSSKSKLHIGFVYPLSSNGIDAGSYTNSFSFHALAGLSKNETGLDFAGLTNVVKQNANGVQFAGLTNHVGNNSRGLTFAGLSNFTGNIGNGFMFAGLLNIAKQEYKGFMFAGLINYTKNQKGAQFAGLLNVAKDAEGVQFAGLLNIAENSKYPIGLINLIKTGTKGLGISYNEIGSSILSFRSGSKYTYGIIGVGYNWEAKKMVTEAGYGIHSYLSSSLLLNHEFKMESLVDSKFTFKTGYQILPTLKVGKHLECFVGTGIQYMRSNNTQRFNMFPSRSIWKNESSNSRQQIFIGYTVGAQVVF